MYQLTVCIEYVPKPRAGVVDFENPDVCIRWPYGTLLYVRPCESLYEDVVRGFGLIMSSVGQRLPCDQWTFGVEFEHR